jgi:hypothetical protein
MNKARAESFSDGVFAFAITLLVLGIQIPDLKTGSNQELRGALIRALPQLVPYVTSFATIGIIWLNHHAMFHGLERVEHISPRRVAFRSKIPALSTAIRSKPAPASGNAHGPEIAAPSETMLPNEKGPHLRNALPNALVLNFKTSFRKSLMYSSTAWRSSSVSPM